MGVMAIEAGVVEGAEEEDEEVRVDVEIQTILRMDGVTTPIRMEMTAGRTDGTTIATVTTTSAGTMTPRTTKIITPNDSVRGGRQ